MKKIEINWLLIIGNIFLLLALISNKCEAKSIKILEIDTGVDTSHPEVAAHIKSKNSILDYFDFEGHGTHIAGIILKNTCKEVELQSCSYYDFNTQNTDEYLECLKLAINNPPDVLNISSGGQEKMDDEEKYLNELSKKGTIIVVAAGNNNKDLKTFNYYPANYKIKNLITVGNLENNGAKAASSNYGLKNMAWEYGVDIYSTLPGESYGFMTGTSQATAIRSNRILLKMCKKLDKKRN